MWSKPSIAFNERIAVMTLVLRVCIPFLFVLAAFVLAGTARAERGAAAKLAEIERIAGGGQDVRVEIPKRPKPAIVLHVAPDGSDANEGTKTRPFATLERARDEIRAIRQRGGIPAGGIDVEIRGGTYPIKQTFTLTEEDSGTEAAPIVYRAHRREAPTFCGGIRLSGFTPVDDAAILARLPEEARGKVVQANLKEYGVAQLKPLELGGFSSGRGFKTHPVNELFYNGEALPMARYPNDGVLYVADIVVDDGHAIHGMKGSKTGRIRYDGDRPGRWKDEKDAMLYGYWFFDWADSYERIESIDTANREIAFAPPYHTYGYRKGARYYAVNLFSELDMPGEWYLDRANAVLYLWKFRDRHLISPGRGNHARRYLAEGNKVSVPEFIELSLFESPMLKMKNVSHVRFQGIRWELGCGDAIHVNGGEHCLFAGCTVRRFGGDGIVVRGGTSHGILSCDIYSMGRGGTVISGGDRKTLSPGGHFVENCHIHNLSRIDHTYTPAVLVDGVGNRIAHNRMHHINSSAIRLGGNDHLVEFNEVHDVLLESDDQGGADMWGDATYRGNVYRYNYWHHNGNWRRIGKDLACGQAGIRLDDAISGVFIYGNVFYKTSSGGAGFGGVQIHGGKDNVLANNIFADCTSAISFSPWGPERWKAFIAKALESPAIDPDLYRQRYPELDRLVEDADTNYVLRNLVWNCKEFLRRDRGCTIQADNIVTGDASHFTNVTRGDFTLKSRAIKPIPFGKIGLYRDAFRRSLPSDDIAAARAR